MLYIFLIKLLLDFDGSKIMMVSIDVVFSMKSQSLSIWLVKDNLSSICKPSNFDETHVQHRDYQL